MKNYQVSAEIAVIGAGPAGLCAAIAAARRGHSVVLIERNGYLGGNATLGLPLLGYLDLQGRRITGGIAQEFIERLQARGASLGHRVCPHHNSVTNIKPEEFKLLAIEMCREAGVKIILHAEAAEADVENASIISAVMYGGGNRITVKAGEYIDCTGNGDLAYLAGCSYALGRPDTHELQPPTVMFTLEKVDTAKLFDYIEAHPEEMTFEASIDNRPGYDAPYFRASLNHVFVGLREKFRELREKGELPVDRDDFIYIKSLNDGEIYVNSTRLLNTDATDIYSITDAELEGQLQTKALTEVMRRYVPGFENCFISSVAPFIGVRETRRFKGVKCLTSDRVIAGEIPGDTIALGGYKIDVHSGKGRSTLFKTVKEPFGIPYGTLVSAEIDNLMFAGRCASFDKETLAAVRVMPQCMNMGEAAGVGASMAIEDGTTPADVDTDMLRAALRGNGAVLSKDEIMIREEDDRH